MKTPKDRLRHVLVVGATPAGIAATNKLGEMGIPVTLVDPDPDMNAKLASEEWRLHSGLTLNYALRPGLLRILRNPSIRTVIPGEVASLKHTPQGFIARLKSLETFVDPERCTLCGLCAEACPVSTPDGSKAVRFHGRQSLPGRVFIDKRRRPLCQASCPLGVNVQGYMALSKERKFKEALELIRKDNVLPGICGRVCTHPCESECRRGGLDEPLAIRDIKRFLADYELETKEHESPKEKSFSPALSEKIAVVGSGPAGLAAAADLARLGYSVTVFEKEEKPGGMLRYGIGPYRLPREILDREIEYIESLGVRFETSHPLDPTEGIEALKKEYAAVIVAVGAWTDRRLRAPGEDLDGVHGCIEFLSKMYRDEIQELRENVAVIGDGNSAFDLARALVRLGAKVTLLSWFPEDLIPADPHEVKETIEEGVTMVYSTRVTEFAGSNGKLTHLVCAHTKPGKPDANGIPWPVVIPGKAPFEMKFDRAIVAIGAVNDQQFTADPDIVMAGDALTGPSTVVQAMASGREAANGVHEILRRKALERKGLKNTLIKSGNEDTRLTPYASRLALHALHPQRPEDRDFPEITPDIPALARAHMPERQPAVRRNSFEEVALGLSEAQVCAEASRCLQCGVCSECLQCVEVCGAQGAIHHEILADEMVEHAGVVIIADPEAAPPVKGEDIIRAYGPKAAKTDVYAMMLRGFAAAAEATLLLGGSAHRLKGHGLSFTPPDPQLSPDIRVGVFVCRCNDSLGWSDELNRCVSELTDLPGVEYAEVIASACAPEGPAGIIRAIREKGLTRVVLASCVCCPLDFICSACTDQRSRLKDGLFNGTGISRAMVETCNLRGEVLRLFREDPVLAEKRFAGLIERSISRAKRLEALPAPARPYNFNTAVIGDSEAAIKSALTLAEAGMEVFLFGTPGRPLSKPLIHPNVHSFNGSSVKGLRGTVGKFELVVDIEGSEQVLHAGAVILGEQARKRIPYMPLEGLPSHIVESSMQKHGVTNIPFFVPGATSIPGLFLAGPPGINVSERIKGAAAAILAAAVMPRRPRQNKGYTVSIDKNLCRGCGRCTQVCPYQAVSFRKNEIGGWYAVVDEALCKGCGNCIPVCPSNAADSPYRDRRYLEQMIEEILL